MEDAKIVRLILRWICDIKKERDKMQKGGLGYERI